MRRVRDLLRALWGRRRRLAPVVLVCGLLVVGGQLAEGVPRETQLRFALGPAHAQVREVAISYVFEGESHRGVTFRYPEGGPRAFRHSVELEPGRWEVRAQLRLASGERSVRRSVVVPAEGTVRIDLFDEALAGLVR